MIESFVAIIPAAGSGKRFSKDVPKQFLKIGNKSVLEFSIKPLLDFSECVGICLVVEPKDEYHKYLEFTENTKISIIEGGSNRMQSVINGIMFWNNSELSFSNILVHDSVRPCLRSSDVRTLLESMDSEKVDGVILGTPCVDTVKQVKSKEMLVKKTLNRSDLWASFTPQVFKREVLVDAALNRTLKDKIFTDEASLVEANNGRLKMIQGSKDNFKITFPEDLNLAKSILISQGRMDKKL